MAAGRRFSIQASFASLRPNSSARTALAPDRRGRAVADVDETLGGEAGSWRVKRRRWGRSSRRRPFARLELGGELATRASRKARSSVQRGRRPRKREPRCAAGTGCERKDVADELLEQPRAGARQRAAAVAGECQRLLRAPRCALFFVLRAQTRPAFSKPLDGGGSVDRAGACSRSCLKVRRGRVGERACARRRA
jgi:hypothetical protein